MLLASQIKKWFQIMSSKETSILDKYTIKDATHKLKCRHCIGASIVKYYTMDCLPLKDLGNGRTKIIVFGDRNWRNRDHVKRIRYVPNHQIARQDEVL